MSVDLQDVVKKTCDLFVRRVDDHKDSVNSEESDKEGGNTQQQSPIYGATPGNKNSQEEFLNNAWYNC